MPPKVPLPKVPLNRPYDVPPVTKLEPSFVNRGHNWGRNYANELHGEETVQYITEHNPLFIDYEYDMYDGETIKYLTENTNYLMSKKRNNNYMKEEKRLKKIIGERKTTLKEKQDAYKSIIKLCEIRHNDILIHFDLINKKIRTELNRVSVPFSPYLFGLCESRSPLFFEQLHTQYNLTKNLMEEAKFHDPKKDVSEYASNLKNIENSWKDTPKKITSELYNPLCRQTELYYSSGSEVHKPKDNWQPITTFQERTIKKFGKYGALALKVCDVYMWGGVAVRFNSLVAGTLIAGPSGCYQIYSPNPVLSAPTIVKSDEGQCNCSLSPSCNTVEGIVDGLNYYWQALPALDITTLKNGEQIYTFNGTKQPAGAVSRPMTAKEAINLLPLVLSLLKKVNKKATNYIKIIIVCIIISVFIFCVYKICKINNFLPRPLRNL